VLGVASASQVRWPVFAFTLPVLDFDSWASSWEVAKSETWVPGPTSAITASIKQLPHGLHTQTARDSR